MMSRLGLVVGVLLLTGSAAQAQEKNRVGGADPADRDRHARRGDQPPCG